MIMFPIVHEFPPLVVSSQHSVLRLPILQKKKFGYELFAIKQFITELYFNMHKIFFKQFAFYFFHLFDYLTSCNKSI